MSVPHRKHAILTQGANDSFGTCENPDHITESQINCGQVVIKVAEQLFPSLKVFPYFFPYADERQ